MLWKCCNQYARKFGKLSRGHRTGKCVFIPIPKKGNAKECSNYRTIALISHASKVMLKILQARLQQYVNSEIPNVQAGFRKGRGTRDQIANIVGSWKKQESSRKTSTLLYWLCQSLWLCGLQQMWKILKEMGIPVHLTCLLRNLYAVQEATVRTGHRAMDWSKIGKAVCQGCILSPCLFNLYVSYLMQNARLDEAQTGIKIARRNIKNLRYADDTTLNGRKQRTKEPLDEGERGEWKSWLKAQHSEN